MKQPKKTLKVLPLLAALSLFAAVPLSAQNEGALPLEQRIDRVTDEANGKALLSEIDAAFRKGTITGPQKELWSGIVLHNLANLNPDPWLDRALSLLESIADSDPVALGYYGSALTIRGGVKSEAEDILGASMDVDAGFKAIDQAVKRSPDNLTLRILRIVNGLSVSAASPFKRHDIIRTDLDWMKKRYDTLSANLKALYHWAEGELALQLSDGGRAVQQFRKAVSADAGGEYGRLARKTLAELED